MRDEEVESDLNRMTERLTALEEMIMLMSQEDENPFLPPLALPQSEELATHTQIQRTKRAAEDLGMKEQPRYTFEKVFWVVAWLQFLSAALMICIEYLASVGIHFEELAFTNMLISLIRSFNIIVIGAMIKFFSNLLDQKNEIAQTAKNF